MSGRYGQALKEATALKRQGDLAGAIARVTEAIRYAELGTGMVQPALRKRISYLLLASRAEEAMSDALWLVEHAVAEVRLDPDLVGTAYSFAYGEKARVLLAMGRREEAFIENVRALWHWQQAMGRQGRTKREHTPSSAAESLLEHVRACNIKLSSEVVRQLVEQGLQDPDPEAMVARFRRSLGDGTQGSV